MDNFCNTIPGFDKFFSAHVAPYTRETRPAFSVAAVGYLPAKTQVIRHVFDTFNYSFILSGTGIYRHKGRPWRVTAPCVITQSPGEEMDYGPENSWEELYLIYPGKSVFALKRRGFVTPDKFMWPIMRPDALYEIVRMLGRALENIQDPFSVDHIDMLCEMLILESLSYQSTSPVSREEKAVRDLVFMVRRNPLADYDFDAIAESRGFHPATFRRHWNRICATPPSRFVMQIRLQEACRKLVETQLTVSEIAYSLGFEDPLYFSRRFRKEYGVTATEYRKAHPLLQHLTRGMPA